MHRSIQNLKQTLVRLNKTLLEPLIAMVQGLLDQEQHFRQKSQFALQIPTTDTILIIEYI